MLVYILLAATLSGLYYGLSINNLLDDDISDIPIRKTNCLENKQCMTSQQIRWKDAKKRGRKQFSRNPATLFVFTSLILSFYYISIIPTLLVIILGTLGGFIGKTLHENISHKADKENWKKLSSEYK